MGRSVYDLTTGKESLAVRAGPVASVAKPELVRNATLTLSPRGATRGSKLRMTLWTWCRPGHQRRRQRAGWSRPWSLETNLSECPSIDLTIAADARVGIHRIERSRLRCRSIPVFVVSRHPELNEIEPNDNLTAVKCAPATFQDGRPSRDVDRFNSRPRPGSVILRPCRSARV